MQKLFYNLSISLLFISSGAMGQSGSLDSAFGDSGIVITDIGISTTDFLYSVAIQPDQKILAAGSANFGGNVDFAVMRYMPDGSPDPEFGTNGLVRVDFNTGDDACHAITLQPDGKIVVAGITQINNLGDFAVARLQSDGSPDSTFGVKGKVVADFGSDYDLANDVVVQTDGKVIAAGRANIGGFTASDFAMIRYLDNGEVDMDFGENGMVISNIHEEDEVQAIALQPGGKIILAGFSSITAKADYAMIRYLDDGSEDKSFGIGGRVVTDLEGTGQSDYETCMLIDKDGKILLGGSANYIPIQGEAELGIARYDQDGHLDPAFGIQGIYILHLGSNSQMHAIAQQPDGKYLFAGKSDAVGFKNQWLLARILNEGTLDTIFGDHGIAVTDMVGNNNEEAFDMVLQNDSRIVLGGVPGDFTKADFTLARYIADFIMTADITEISCFGAEDASITIHAQGGAAPLKYSITGGAPYQVSNSFEGLPPGDYIITVCDASGVTGQFGPIHIDDAPAPPAVQVDVTGNTITVTVDGPGPYSYSADGGVTYQAGNTFPGLTDGAYQVVVEDENGCEIYNDVAIVQATGVEVINGIAFSISPNPCKDFIEIEVDLKISSLKAIIVDMSGRLMSSEEVKPDHSGKFMLSVNQLANGKYSLWLKDGDKWMTSAFIKQ